MAAIIVLIQPEAKKAGTDGFYFEDAGLVVLIQALVMIF
jgi:hypothetical protein